MARIIGYLLLFGLIIAALKIALAVGVFIAIIIGLITRPKETIGMVAFLAILSLIGKFPGPSLAVIAVLGLVALFVKVRKSAPPPDP